MLSLELSFPGNRYHATPWNHHVNEGVVEWPPSPWRVLRALVATRHLKAAAEVSEEQLARIVETLAAQQPEYWLPRGSAAHTRHYMPLYQPDKTTKVFDTFIHVEEDGVVVVTWPDADLAEEDRGALQLLARRMGYLGRAESWAEVRLRSPGEPPIAPNTFPVAADDSVSDGEEIIQTLAPMPPAELAAWRARTYERELERLLGDKRERAAKRGKDPAKVKLSASDKKKLDAAVPATLMDALHVDTGELHKQGWSGVPGARWVDYARPRDRLALLPVPRSRPSATELPTVARFAVASDVPPRLTEAVSVAERVRRALMSRSDGAPVFAGKDASGNPLRGHQHAFVLPEANGEHGYVTHVTLHAPMGFDADARRAMDGLRRVWGPDRYDVQLVLVGVGRPEDFAGTDLRAGQCPLLAESTTWISRTPFVPTRHPKTNRRGEPKLDDAGLQVGSAEHDLRRLLAAEGLPRPVHVESRRSTLVGGKETRWLAFETRRFKGGGLRGARVGAGFELTFDRPVRGPIAVGFGAHFGLGVFVPAGVGS